MVSVKIEADIVMNAARKPLPGRRGKGCSDDAR
jgi:hypothetical protein